MEGVRAAATAAPTLIKELIRSDPHLHLGPDATLSLVFTLMLHVNEVS